MKHGAAAAFAVRVDEIADRRIKAGLAQRLDHDPSLPRAIGRALPMLQRAAAADAEMRTDRCDALRVRFFNCEEMPPVGLPGHRLNFDGFAGKRARNIDRSISTRGHAIAAMADVIDRQMLSHVQP